MNILERLDTQTTRWIRGSIVAAVTLCYFGYVFQIPRGDFLRSGLSGWLDPYFLNSVLENWYHSLRTFSDPASPPMYFPAKGALGYSCGLILYAPFYMIVRPFLHPFTAYTVTLFLVMETGSVCLYVLFRKFIGLRFLESLLLTVFFISSRNVINSWHTNVWSQTASIFLVPPILLLTIGAARMHARRPGVLMAGVSGLLWTLLFSQDFYTGWFVLLISTLLLTGALIIAPQRRIVQRIATDWKAYRAAGAAFLIGACVGSLVFVWIYIGAYREQGGFPEQQLMNALIPRAVPDWSHPIDAMRSLVVYVGVRPFELTLLVGLLAWVPWTRIPLRVRLYALWFLVVSVIVVLGALRLGQYQGWRNYSFWKQIFRALPGYSMIRDPKRIIYTYELAVAIFTGLFLARLAKTSIIRNLTVALVFVLLVAEPNREVFHFERPNAVFDRWVRAPIDIDRSCQSFFFKLASNEYNSRSGHVWSLYGVDGVFIAMNVSIPTLNGYTAWQPHGWSLGNPPHPLYMEAVRQWIDQNHLSGVCELDIEARTMRPFQ